MTEEEEKPKYSEFEADEVDIVLLDKDGNEIVTLDIVESLKKLGYVKEEADDDDDDDDDDNGEKKD